LVHIDGNSLSDGFGLRCDADPDRQDPDVAERVTSCTLEPSGRANVTLKGPVAEI
jgi:hypothetical protein